MDSDTAHCPNCKCLKISFMDLDARVYLVEALAFWLSFFFLLLSFLILFLWFPYVISIFVVDSYLKIGVEEIIFISMNVYYHL